MKRNLSILFIPNVITCCCMFYNLILDGQDVDVNALIFNWNKKFNMILMLLQQGTT